MHRPGDLLSSQKKAKCHRRRYAPVGPAGVLFQAHREQLNVQNGAASGNSKNDETHEEERGVEFSQGIVEHTKAPTAGVVFYSRAWVDMLCQLQIVTPKLRAYLSEEQRYTTIRRFMPQKFTMIPEILGGQVDWKLPPGKSLLVLVHAIDARSDTLWVVELLDETGFKISAWMKPRFVEQEQKLSKYIRIGMVWMLKNVTILLDSSPEKGVDDRATDEMNEHKRMLLVGEHNIESVLAPPSNEEESEASDPRFIEWMEKRNTLTSSLDDVASEDCDLDVFCENEEIFSKFKTTDRTDGAVVQEDGPCSPEHCFSPRERRIPPENPSARSTGFVETAETRDLTEFVTDPGNPSIHVPKNNQLTRSSPTIVRKRKSVGNEPNMGLWTACQGEDLATFSCDDDGDDECKQHDEPSNDHGHRDSASPLLSPLNSRQSGASANLPVMATMFQNTDFQSLELDFSSDED